MVKSDKSEEIKALKKELRQAKRKNKALEEKYNDVKLQNKILKCESKKKRENCFYPLSQKKRGNWRSYCSQIQTRRNSHPLCGAAVCICWCQFTSGSEDTPAGRDSVARNRREAAFARYCTGLGGEVRVVVVAGVIEGCDGRTGKLLADNR